VAILMDFFSKEHIQSNGRIKSQWRCKTCLGIDYANDLSIIDESLRKMNQILEALQVGMSLN